MHRCVSRHAGLRHRPLGRETREGADAFTSFNEACDSYLSIRNSKTKPNVATDAEARKFLHSEKNRRAIIESEVERGAEGCRGVQRGAAG